MEVAWSAVLLFPAAFTPAERRILSRRESRPSVRRWAQTSLAIDPPAPSGAMISYMVYVVQTNAKIIERCLLMATDPGELVLDPTCGSGTTPTVAEQWGRRWITIDTSRAALALARARIMGARYQY